MKIRCISRLFSIKFSVQSLDMKKIKPIKLKIDRAKEIKRNSRAVLGSPSQGKKIGAFEDKSKEYDKDYCRQEIEEED